MLPLDQAVLVAFDQLPYKLTTQELVALFGRPRGGRILQVCKVFMFMMVLLSLMVFNLFVFFSSHDSGRPLPWELHGQPLSTDSELENR